GGNAVAVDGASVLGDLAVSLTGKGGGNTITVDSVFINGDTSLRAAGGSNSIAIDNQDPGSAFGRVDIAMTGRNNLLAINCKGKPGGIHGGTDRTTFDGEVSAKLGAGNDTLVLAQVGLVVFETAATFNGGPGKNTALVNSANVAALQGVPTLVNFS